MEIIPLSGCEDRGIYLLHSRNLTMGVFRNCTQGFIGIREKFGSESLFEEYHWELGAGNFGTVRPYKKIGVLRDEIELETGHFGYCRGCQQVGVCYHVQYFEPIEGMGGKNWGQGVCMNCTNADGPYFKNNGTLQAHLDSLRCDYCLGAAEVWIPDDAENQWGSGKFGLCKECGGNGTNST